SRKVVLAGGCFWCIEAVFEPLKGVTDVTSGYAGGTADTADYKKVSAGHTNHAESVQITYDPAKISYATLLRVFMTMHSPTTKDGQHPDYGHQYRSAIFYANDDEKRVAEAYIKQLDDAKVFNEPITTSLEKLEKFYPAEEYHQDYVRKHPDDPYVVRWALPKLEKLRQKFPELLQSSAPAGAPAPPTSSAK
ncbi:MAG: peptide-methionine (S)-S-oxide reductase, partial [Humisphaera sp.]|nr:peptide-methionine (S)-S-oxide reductase [Humisphaera sp.]